LESFAFQGGLQPGSPSRRDAMAASVPSQVRNCAAPSLHLRSKISCLRT